MSVKVRIAPSPTGNLHIGTAQSALFNWLYAKKMGGSFLVRIEDTDRERSKKEYEDNIVSGLQWLGLTWDGEISRQSERLDIYKRCLEELLSSGKAVVKKFSEAEKEAMRKEGREVREQIIELVVDPAGPAVMFEDEVRGPISIERKNLGYVSLAKDENTPLYNFAAVVDDVEMEITHVIRGEDHISNTPKQILIYEALGKPIPKFAHLPLILNPDRTKLSKRKGAASIDDYRKEYLPEAMVNFIGFLGYTYSKEILSKEEMAQEFELSKIHKSGVVFDLKKLNWINVQYVRQLDPVQFKRIIGIDIPDAAVPFITERLEKLSDVREFDYFWQEPEYEPELLLWKSATSQDTRTALNTVRDIIEKTGLTDPLALREQLDAAAAGNRGALYWPLRVALSGKKASPDPIDIATVVGTAATLKRIDAAIVKLL